VHGRSGVDVPGGVGRADGEAVRPTTKPAPRSRAGFACPERDVGKSF
jgi:hypothetical protein